MILEWPIAVTSAGICELPARPSTTRMNTITRNMPTATTIEDRSSVFLLSTVEPPLRLLHKCDKSQHGDSNIENSRPI